MKCISIRTPKIDVHYLCIKCFINVEVHDYVLRIANFKNVLAYPTQCVFQIKTNQFRGLWALILLYFVPNFMYGKILGNFCFKQLCQKCNKLQLILYLINRTNVCVQNIFGDIYDVRNICGWYINYKIAAEYGKIML